MRPNLDDILAGVQRLLQNDLVPALATTPFLAEQAMYATLLLEYGKKLWPRLHLALAEEHGDLRATLATVVAQLAADPAAATLAIAIERQLLEPTTDVASSTLDVLAARNASLRDAVSQAVALLDEREAEHAAPLEAVRATIDAYLQRHAARQYHELEVLGISW
jgi:hypothetical protein